MTHEIKIRPEYFEKAKDWSKPFELRKDDRPYQLGDIVILKEFSYSEGIYTGRQAVRKISYILRDCPDYGLKDGYCIIGFAFEPIGSGKIDCDKMDKCEKLQLPPANCSEFPNNSDTISRQAAIEALQGRK